MNGYLIILIVAAIVGAIMLVGWCLCVAADDEWHLDERDYRETPLGRWPR